MTILFCILAYLIIGTLFNRISATKLPDYQYYLSNAPAFVKVILIVIWPYLVGCLIYGGYLGIKKIMKKG